MYMTGFGNHFATEAVPGALPQGQNSPQHTPFGLYAEQLSGTAFTAPRAHNLRSWLYRLRPSADHAPFTPIEDADAPFAPPTPNRLRWSPPPLPEAEADFIDGLFALAGNGDPARRTGVRATVYAANRSMARVFFNADAEMMIRLRQRQIGEDRVRHVGIIMLAGVDQHRLEIRRGGERVPERRHLHEIGPRGGDQVDPCWCCHTLPLDGICDRRLYIRHPDEGQGPFALRRIIKRSTNGC